MKSYRKGFVFTTLDIWQSKIQKTYSVNLLHLIIKKYMDTFKKLMEIVI